MEFIQEWVARQTKPVQAGLFLLLVVVVTAFVFLKPTALDQLAKGDCIDQQGGIWEEVDCDSPEADLRIGGSCQVILTLGSGGESGTRCAEPVGAAQG